MTDEPYEVGRKALGEIDALLAARPQKDDLRAAEVVTLLAAWRDTLIPAASTAEGAERLERLNAVISVALATHFPQGATPWAELEMARGWLASLLPERAREPVA